MRILEKLEQVKQDLAHAEARVLKLTEALKFYADKKHFRYGNLDRHGWPEMLPAEDGEVARAVLKEPQ